jgi:nucleoid-associated protein YgaU
VQIQKKPTPLIIIDLYTVKSGDTFSDIAQHYYKNGDIEHYLAIFNANLNPLTDPGQITEGQKLIIPKF